VSPRKHHPQIGEIDDGEPDVIGYDAVREWCTDSEAAPAATPKPARRYAEDVEEIVIEAPRVPEPPSTRRVLRNIAVAALRRLADKLDQS